MNPNEMTLDQCRDWLHIDASPGGYRFDAFTKTAYYKTQVNHDWSRTHPIAPTLDAIAAAMPEGWGIEVSYNNWWNDPTGGDNHLNKCMWQAVAHQMTKDYFGPDGMCIVGDPCDTELLARARLAVACRMAERGSK